MPSFQMLNDYAEMEFRTKLITTLILINSLQITQAIHCPSGYGFQDDICYRIFIESKTWDEANQYCGTTGGGQELLSFASDDQGEFFRRKARETGQDIYIGLHDNEGTNTNYIWMNGASYKGTLWAPGEPNNYHGPEPCVEFRRVADYRLNDHECSIKKGFLCKACSLVPHCLPGRSDCNPGPSSRSACSKCEFLYKPAPDNFTCQRICQYDNPCWPGTCTDEYLSRCTCFEGFQKFTNGGKTTCEFSQATKPSIDSCSTTVGVVGGEKKYSVSNSTSNECKYLQDFYGNFEPEFVSYEITTSFIVNLTAYLSNKPDFITYEMNFGITDLTVSLRKETPTGKEQVLKTSEALADMSDSKDVKDVFHSSGTLNTTAYLSDGDRLCIHIDAKGGGHFATNDVRIQKLHHFAYNKQSQIRKLCYRFDITKPEVANLNSHESLEVNPRLTRDGVVTTSFRYWSDPVHISKGDKSLASGIEKYTLSVYEMFESDGKMAMGTSIVSTKTITVPDDPAVQLNITSTTPKLYCLFLEVKDVADNVRFARRFVLFDNTSYIEVDTAKTFTITSAAPDTNYEWQTHHNDICMAWKDYFLNKFYLSNHVLNPIKANLDTVGIYEQETGELPISGTPNVHGIVDFRISWILEDTIHHEGSVNNFIEQTYCKKLQVNDGQTYTFNLTAIDIINNSFTESRQVSIDQSAPHINNIWLINDGYESLYVHGDKEGDLTEIHLSFEVLDPHSGIQEIEWTLGISDKGRELISRNISINETENCDSVTHCICPAVGKCQITKYIVRLKGNIIQNGDHNRKYYFKIKATNYARLYNIEYMEILVDRSPPETGVVVEGPTGTADIDYTSASDFLVRWHGFVDHESGLKFYRIALADRCLQKHEMQNRFLNLTILFFDEIPYSENSIRLNVDFIGKRYVTIVASNNAVELSEPACSDGITRDVQPPSMKNLTLLNGRWRESIHCVNDEIWFVHAYLKKIRLEHSNACISFCKDVNEVSTLPSWLQEHTVSEINTTSEEICRTFMKYSSDTFIYLPSDQIQISWMVEEDGSQIDEYYVGIGIDRSEAVSPQLKGYESTQKRPYYKENHAGFSADDAFFIFVKIVNKAGLEYIATVGPIVIDKTPPVQKQSLDLTVNNSHVTVRWDENTFMEPEQSDSIDTVFFHIEPRSIASPAVSQSGQCTCPSLLGVFDKSFTLPCSVFKWIMCLKDVIDREETGGISVTPVIEWNKYRSPRCVNFNGDCITYPVKPLQNEDNLKGRWYTMVLFVYNNAGHMLRTSTRSFQVPSKYPPGHGSVIDIDPSNLNHIADISVHTVANTLCCNWSGFDHHNNVTFEVGVGTIKGNDDIVRFHYVDSGKSVCLNSSSFLTEVQYFMVIRSSCTGGVTVSSSNGVIIVNEEKIVNSLTVHTGPDCKSLPNDYVKTLNSSDIVNGSFSLGIKFQVGLLYYFQVKQHEDRIPINFQTVDARIMKADRYWYIATFYTEQPIFRMSNSFNISFFHTIFVTMCRNGSYLEDNGTLSGYWKHIIPTGVRLDYEVAVGTSCSAENENDPCVKLIYPFKRTYSLNYTSIENVVENNVAVFLLLVRPCSNTHCFHHVSSSFVTPKYFVSIEEIEGEFEKNKISNCQNIVVTWTLSGSLQEMNFLQWAISKDPSTMHTLSKWSTILPSGQSQYKVDTCANIPATGHETLHACVRAYTFSSVSTMKCGQLRIKSRENEAVDTIYDFDSSLPSWQSIITLLNSRYLGTKRTLLHDAELDFGRSSTTVSGAIAQVSERKVTWYLMTTKRVPESCETSPDCVLSRNTNASGYVTFDSTDIPTDTALYICAFSNSKILEREYHTDEFDEIKSCSDGFVIDTMHPSGGHIYVPNHNGYITNIKNTIVQWDNFTDNIDSDLFGHSSSIKYYTLSAGTTAGSDDLFPQTNVGHIHTHIFDKIDAPSGTNLYITVTATDLAGLQTSVTSGAFILDSSSPSCGQIYIEENAYVTSVIASDNINVHLAAFQDLESGIDHFDVGIGTRNDTFDVLTAPTITSNSFVIDLLQFNTADGCHYYVIVQAVNRAGLKSDPATARIIIDKSSPAGGFVIDGEFEDMDLDYQKNDTNIAGHWYGFSDHHSGIHHYRVGLGLYPYSDDEESFLDVGLRTVMVWKKAFTPGCRYYITVEACNGANLCSKISSDGIILDRSGPNPGVVRVGHDTHHGKFQSGNSTVHIQWAGFSDRESGIDHYEVCIGTGRYMCDVYPFFNCLLSSSITKTGLKIPASTNIYVTVKAFNRVGQSVSAASDAFQIDTSTPVSVEKPSIVLHFNGINHGLVKYDPSVLAIQWKFEDLESPLVKHFVTLKTHHEGHSPVENLEFGALDRMSVSLDRNNWLHNGDTYFAIVTSCNAAGLCASAETDAVVIDATPPHQGGFTSDLNWENVDSSSSQVFLSWHSFLDAESGIDKFYVSISRHYSGSELSGGVVTMPFDNNTEIQSGTLKLTQTLKPNDKIYLSIWASNFASLNSSVSRISVNCLSSSKDHQKEHGILEIEKHSCETQYCSGDCTCAIVGKPCEPPACSANETQDSVNDIHDINIYWGSPNKAQIISSSSACLAVYWNSTRVAVNTSTHILRYEYSIGLFGEKYGVGIFRKDEIPWVDVGLREEIVHCLTGDLSLMHSEKYVFYLRVWIGRDKFYTLSSTPITIDATPPSVRKGGFIKDSDESCSTDFDVIDWVNTITGCWNNVFTERQGQIVGYTVALGTSPNADDIMKTVSIELQISFTAKNTSMHPGTKYFFTVTAYNNVGLHTSLSSDGFAIDIDVPRAGAVFNTKYYRNREFQSESTSFSISWNGFTDDHSGIKSYFVALVDENGTTDSNIPFFPVQLKTQHTFENVRLTHGQKYHGLVKAVDAIGHESEISISHGRTIDTSAPVGITCPKFEEVQTLESSYNANGFAVTSFSTNVSKGSIYKISGRINKSISIVDVVLENGPHHHHLSTAVNHHDGSRTFEHIFASPYSGFSNITLVFESSTRVAALSTFLHCSVTHKEQVRTVEARQISTSMISVRALVYDMESSIYKVLAGIGLSPGGFQIRPLLPIPGDYNIMLKVDVQHATEIFVTAIAENHAGLKTVLYSSPVIIDHTGPVVKIENTTFAVIDEIPGDRLDAQQVEINVTWSAFDNESGIHRCYCSYGYLPGSEDLMLYKPADTDLYCQSDSLPLHHGTKLFGNIRCLNNVGLTTEVHTKEIPIIYRPPIARGARVIFVPQDRIDNWSSAVTSQSYLHHDNYYIQSALDKLTFEWTGFDATGSIEMFKYRITDGDTSVVNWTATDKTAVMLTFGHQSHLKGGTNYTVEVVAVNSEQLASEATEAYIFVDDRKPQLTGNQVQVTEDGRHVTINWKEVFLPHPIFNCVYSVTVGSQQYYADIVDIMYTETVETELDIPDVNRFGDMVHELFIGLECTFPTSLSKRHDFNFRLM